MSADARPLRKALLTIYRYLSSHYGPTGWWPGDTPFEIAVGAILTQNTAWNNVEKAIANLKARQLLHPGKILACPDNILHEALRPSGYFRVKAIRLRAFCSFLEKTYHGDMARMAKEPLEVLRKDLLGIKGIGPETADDILLYACEKPIFVVDAYTRRILCRHALCPGDIPYHELQDLFHRHLPHEVELFKEFHGLIVFTGKDFCRRRPKCEACPLRPLLPT